MSAIEELVDWLRKERPEVYEEAFNSPDSVVCGEVLTRRFGVNFYQFPDTEEGWRDYLSAIQGVAPSPEPVSAPKKPAPALPLECWADASRFNADRAHEAMVLLCRGN